MLQNNVSGLPVVDDQERVCGMLTEGDLLLRREIRLNQRPFMPRKSYRRPNSKDT